MSVFILVDGLKNDWKNQINLISNRELMKPFDALTLNFIEQLSKQILLSNESKRYPEIIALGYWLRKSHIQMFEQEYLSLAQNKFILPRGIVLHFAPANVDTMFVYSWIVSLLMGNSNIIKISHRLNDNVRWLLNIIDKVLSNDSFKKIKERTCVITYEHNNDTTSFLSSLCQVRVIWGGDNTVNLIRAIPIRPSATEITFTNRYSHALLNAASVNHAHENEISELVAKFYKDLTWFHQNACSSPRSIIWVGNDTEIKHARNRFWQYFDNKAAIESHISSHEKSTQLISVFHYAALGKLHTVDEELIRKPFMRVKAETIDEQMRTIHAGAGVLIEVEREHLKDLYDILSERDQTIGSYGFERSRLADFIYHQPSRLIDRIVPIGQMLNFDIKWDGYHLFQSLSREVVLI